MFADRRQSRSILNFVTRCVAAQDAYGLINDAHVSAMRALEYVADQRGISGPHVALARLFRDAVAKAWGKPLVMNISMPMAAVMLDLGFPVSVVKAIPLLARTAGILGHLAEEQKNPVGFLMAGKAEEAITYRGDKT